MLKQSFHQIFFISISAIMTVVTSEGCQMHVSGVHYIW